MSPDEEAEKCPRCRRPLPGAAWGSDRVCLECWESHYLLPETPEDRAEAWRDSADLEIGGMAS